MQLDTEPDEARFAALWACLRSGQISAAQWVAHLRDEPGLVAWLRERRSEEEID